MQHLDHSPCSEENNNRKRGRDSALSHNTAAHDDRCLQRVSRVPDSRLIKPRSSIACETTRMDLPAATTGTTEARQKNAALSAASRMLSASGRSQPPAG